MAPKPIEETTRITVSIEGGPHTEGRGGLVAAVVNAIMAHGNLGHYITELDRNDEAASITIESTSFIYADDGNYLYEEETQGLTDANPAAVPEGERVTYRDAILQAMKPDESKTEPEQEQADYCDCPACQLRRIIMAGVDKAKAGSDRTEIGLYAVTSRGLVRVA